MLPAQRLLQRARQFDEQALAEVYETYSPGIFRYAYRLLGDYNLAEECTAETFYRLLRAFYQNNGPVDTLQGYLYRSAHNWITDYYRRRPPETPLPEDAAGDDPLPNKEQPGPPEIVEATQQQQQVRKALAMLTPEQRQVILLKYIEGWNNTQVAEALHKPVGAVKALQHRALESMRRLLNQPAETIRTEEHKYVDKSNR